MTELLGGLTDNSGKRLGTEQAQSKALKNIGCCYLIIDSSIIVGDYKRAHHVALWMLAWRRSPQGLEDPLGPLAPVQGSGDKNLDRGEALGVVRRELFRS